MKSLIIIYLLFSGLQKAPFCRTKCEVVYEYVENMPVFPGGDTALFRHMRTKILPIIGAFHKKEPDEYITSLWVTLDVDKTGHVADVHFKTVTSPALQEQLRNEFLKISGFKPARYKGHTVCAVYPYTIRCILWQED